MLHNDDMPTYKAPGVYIEETSFAPRSIESVPTADPVFVGYTAKARDDDGRDRTNVPTRIGSLLEFTECFGRAAAEELTLEVTTSGLRFRDAPAAAPHVLYYSMQLYFENGGGPCWILSVGALRDPPRASRDDLVRGFDILEEHDEPTLLVFPDSCLLSDADHGAVVTAALAHCAARNDRFAIIDVRDAVPGRTDDLGAVTANFRDHVPDDPGLTRYGAAYFPYLRTALPYVTEESKITIAGSAAIDDATVKEYLATDRAALVTVPPSGAIAGIYVRTDLARGVFKAPANEEVRGITAPAVAITDEFNDGLGFDPVAGKSINPVRTFEDRRHLVWGARTLAGNEPESRYVPVRRFLIFVEESVRKATETFVFEPNDARLWTRARSMIENFLTAQWRTGALQGTTPDDAFYVRVGLNETMTDLDILEGRLIVEIGMAVVRPAEFIILRFMHKMAEP